MNENGSYISLNRYFILINENQRFKSCCSEPYSGKINQASLWAVVATQIDNDNNNLDRR